MLKLKLFTSAFVLCLLIPTRVWANLPACEDVFPSALGAFNNKEVVLEKDTRVTGQQNNLIYTTKLSAESSARCNNQQCQKSDIEPVQAIAPDVSGWKSRPGATEKLSGDYYINGSLALYADNFPIAGPTRIYVTGAVDISGSSTAHNAEDLIIYVEGDLKISFDMNLYGYSNSLLEVDKKADVKGSLIGGNDVKFLEEAQIEYVAPTSSNLDIICESNSQPTIIDPIAEFRFDEFSWVSGLNNQVIESINSDHGTAFNIQPAEGKMCNAANFDDSTINGRIELDEDLISGRAFTIAAWIKSEFSGNQALISGAKNNGNANEVIWWHPNSQTFEPWIKGNAGSQIGITDFSDNQWRHFVWRRDGSESCFFVNGQRVNCITDNNGGTTDVNSLILGQEQDNLGGGFDSGQRFRGLVDELLFFDEAISDSQIQTIYQNQDQGLGWDGADRDAYCGANGWWRLDNDFLDANLDDPHDLLPSNSPAFSITAPGPANTIGSQSTCEYVEFDGSNYASVDDSGLFNYQELTVSAWIYPTQRPNSGLYSIVSKDEHFEFHLTSARRLNWWWRNTNRRARSFNSTRRIPLNQWTHVAVVYSAGRQQMYINGAADASRSFSDGLADSPCDFYIGTDTATNTATRCGGVITSRNFRGNMDEVRIYSRALSQQEIQSNMNTVRSCDNVPSIDHYRLTLNDNSGLTCEAEPMTIEACADAACTSYYPNSTSVSLSPSAGGSLIWSPSDSFSFSGSQALSLSNTTASRVQYSLASANPTSGFRCFVGGNEVSLADCYTDFADTGFKISTIADQVADIPYAAELQAVKRNDNTGACENVFSGNQTVNFTNNYISPTAASALTFKVNNTDVSSSTPVTVNFDPTNDFKATLALNYQDAGEISLTAEANTPNGAQLSDTSNTYVVRPQEFDVSVTGNPNATDANGTVFKMATEEFAVRIEAHNASGVVTTNFNSAQFIGALKLAHQLEAPSSPNKGILTPSSATFNGGIATISDATFSEVGIIQITAELEVSDYINPIGVGTISGNLSNVGRFIPAQFEMKTGKILSGCDSFTYYGQPLDEFSYEVHAQDTLGNRLENYLYSSNASDNFAKATIEELIENDDPDNTKYKSAIDLASRYSLTGTNFEWDSGRYIVDLTDVALNRDITALASGTAPSIPMTQLLPLIRLTDPDGKLLNDLDQDANAQGGPVANYDSKAIAGPLEMRFGRLVVKDNFGSEFENLQIPLRVEYWDGFNFVVNSRDSLTCSSYEQGRLVVEDNQDIVGSGNGFFVNGVYDPSIEGMQLKAPEVPRSFTVDYVSPESWLRFDWNHDNNYDDINDNPSGVLQFGRFRGNDRVIYWREN